MWPVDLHGFRFGVRAGRDIGSAPPIFCVWALLVMEFTCFMVVVKVVVGDGNPTMAFRAAYLLEPTDDAPVFQETRPLKVLSLAMIVAIVARGIYPHHRNELT